MSRAFVDETDGNLTEDDIPKLLIPLPEGVKNYVTPDGAAKTRKEFEELKNTLRPKLSSEVSKDVTGGDSADSEAVLAIRRKLRSIDRRIEYLTEMIERMEVIDPKNQESNRVLFGAMVTVLENDSARRVFKIVGVDESDPKKGVISWISPIAKALLSRSVGDTVTIPIPKGETKISVVKVEYK